MIGWWGPREPISVSIYAATSIWGDARTHTVVQYPTFLGTRVGRGRNESRPIFDIAPTTFSWICGAGIG